MPEPTAEQVAAEELVRRAREQGLCLTGPDGLLKQLTKVVIETALDQEMTEHLGHERNTRAGNESGNVRNGSRAKKVLTGGTGQVAIEVPRDRDGTFEPQIVKKRQRRLGGVDETVLSLYAKGLTTGEISAHFAEIYGASVSRETISRITDKVIEEMQSWQARPLDEVYAAVFIDAIVVKVRDGQVANRPVYAAIGVTLAGDKDILGLWAGTGGEGAKFWMSVLTDLRNRGIRDVFFVVCDGLKGLPDVVVQRLAAGDRADVHRALRRPAGYADLAAGACRWRPDRRREGRHNPALLIDTRLVGFRRGRGVDRGRSIAGSCHGPASGVCGGVRRRAGPAGVYDAVGVRADVPDGAREPLAGRRGAGRGRADAGGGGAVPGCPEGGRLCALTCRRRRSRRCWASCAGSAWRRRRRRLSRRARRMRLLGRYRRYLVTERGLAAETAADYAAKVRPFLAARAGGRTRPGRPDGGRGDRVHRGDVPVDAEGHGEADGDRAAVAAGLAAPGGRDPGPAGLGGSRRRVLAAGRPARAAGAGPGPGDAGRLRHRARPSGGGTWRCSPCWPGSGCGPARSPR